MSASPNDHPVFTASNQQDLIELIPALFGFVPADSIIAVATNGPQRRFGFRMRMDLPTGDAVNEAGRTIAHYIAKAGADGCIMMSVTDNEDDRQLASDVIEQASAALASKGVETIVTVQGQNSDIAEPSGEAVARAVLAGVPILSSRSEVEATFNPYGPEERNPEMLVKAVSRAEWLNAESNVEQLLETVTRTNVAEVAHEYQEMSRHLDGDAALPLLTVCAFAYWLNGDGARSSIAVERALAIDPDNPLAQLVHVMLSEAVDPSKWAEFSR